MRYAVLPLLAVAIVLTACGQMRRYGDTGGAPVAFTVHLERDFVRAMRYNQWRPSAGAGMAMDSGGGTAVGTGVGFSFSATTVYLYGGDGPAEAQIFIKELKWGDNTFTVPLTPGHKLTLTVKAEGGREGWESIGTITVPHGDRPRVDIRLDSAHGASVTVLPAEPANTVEGAAHQASQPGADDQRMRDQGLRYDPPPRTTAPAPAPNPEPPGEHADAGDKPPSDKNPPVKVEPGPPPGAPPVTAPNATPAAPSAPTGPDQP